MFDLSERLTIGIVSGSGPEAGIDLWQKILAANKDMLGEQFQGDLQAPTVIIFSIPELGYSMELEKNYDQVWETLKHTVLNLSEQVDIFAIACNTLNIFAEQIQQLPISARLISTLDVVRQYIQQNNLTSIALLGALPVMELGPWSVFQPLTRLPINIETADCKQLQDIIYTIKERGSNHPSVTSSFASIIESLSSTQVFLACTELPLIPIESDSHSLIDVTDLLAYELVKTSLDTI